MIKKAIKFCQKNYFYFFPVIILIVFILSIWDKNFYLGGDFIFPLKPQDNLLRSLYLWEEQNNGFSFFKYMLLFWQLPFFFLNLLGVPTYLGVKIFIVCFYILGFICCYFLYKTLFKGTKYEENKLALFAALFFLLNPSAILVLVGTLPLYGFPICLFFLLKFLETKKTSYLLLFSFFINISFFPDLPQAKLLITFCLATFFLVLTYGYIQKISVIKLFQRLFLLSILTLLLNAFVFLPFVNDTLGAKGIYGQYSKEVTVYDGNADLYSAALPFTMRFFNSNLIDKESSLGKFLSSPIFIIWSFSLWLFALLTTIFIKDKKAKTILFFLLVPLVLFIFIAKGPNPPFGEVYRLMLAKIPVFKLFRTTSTVIIAGAIFYSFWLTLCVYYFSQKWKYGFIGLLIINLLIFHPIYLGYKLENSFGGGSWQKGVSLPNEYFQLGDRLDSLEDNNKVLSLPLNDGYVSKNWFYSGQSILSWLTKKPLIHTSGVNLPSNPENFSSQEACLFSSLYNVGYVVEEKDAAGQEKIRELPFPGENLINNNYFNLTKIEPACQAPQIYIPKQLIYFQGNKNNLFLAASKLNRKQEIIVYQEGNDQNKNTQFLKDANSVIIESSPKNAAFDVNGRNYYRLFLGQENYLGEIFYPYVRINPGSFLYKIVLLKEQKEEELNVKDQKKLFAKELFYATKRISEITKWGVQNQWWQENLKRYGQKINKAIELSGDFGNQRDNLELVIEYLDRHQEKIEKLSQTTAFWNKEKLSSWREVFKSLKEKTKNVLPTLQFSQLEYEIKTPVFGQYEASFIFNDNQSFFPSQEKKKLFLNNSFLREIDNQDLGNFTLEPKTNVFKINLGQPVNLIDPQKWQFYNTNYAISNKLNSLLFENLNENLNLPKEISISLQEISDWQPNQLYLLKINFKKLKEDSKLNLLVKERRNTFDRLAGDWLPTDSVLLRDQLDKIENYQVLLRADRESLGAFIYLYSQDGKVLVDSIELTKVYLPKLLLAAKIKNEDLSEGVILESTKLSPVKYKVSLSKTSEPFYLIFSQNYDQGWKIYDGQKSLADKNHYLVNGYANAWYLESSNEERELTVEYQPQKWFVRGIIVSFVSFLVISLISLRPLIKRRKK